MVDPDPCYANHDRGMVRRRPRTVVRQSSSELSIQEQINATLTETGAFDLTPWDLPPVIAAVGAYADTITQLPFIAERAGHPRPDQPRFLSTPNDHETFGDLLNRAVHQLFGWGHFWILPLQGNNPQWPGAIELIGTSGRVGEWDTHGRAGRGHP